MWPDLSGFLYKREAAILSYNVNVYQSLLPLSRELGSHTLFYFLHLVIKKTLERIAVGEGEWAGRPSVTEIFTDSHSMCVFIEAICNALLWFYMRISYILLFLFITVVGLQRKKALTALRYCSHSFKMHDRSFPLMHYHHYGFLHSTSPQYSWIIREHMGTVETGGPQTMHLMKTIHHFDILDIPKWL